MINGTESGFSTSSSQSCTDFLTVLNGNVGGALSLHSSDIQLLDSTFDGFTTSYQGGAVFSVEGSLIMSNCNFENEIQSLLNGGAVFAFEAQVRVSNSTFHSQAQGNGGGLYLLDAVFSFSNSACIGAQATLGGKKFLLSAINRWSYELNRLHYEFVFSNQYRQ